MKTFRNLLMTQAARTWSPDEPAAAPAAAPAAPAAPAPDPAPAAPATPAPAAPAPADPKPADEPKVPDPEPTLLADKPKEGEPAADEAKPDAPTVPEVYELKGPEGVELDAATVEQATPVFKELGLTNEQAQKITDLYAGQILPAVAQTVQGETLRLLGMDGIGQWTAQTKADATIGGAALEENLAMAAKGRDQFATPELRAFLETSRIGNHPEMVRLFATVGRAISEGSFITGDTGQGEGQPLYATLYGAEFQPKT